MNCLDLFCGIGGCSMGYRYAGFEVVGVDIQAQPDYPFDYLSVVERKREALGIGWTWNGRQLSEAIPPAYTAWIGTHARLFLASGR